MKRLFVLLLVALALSACSAPNVRPAAPITPIPGPAIGATDPWGNPIRP